MLSLGVPMILMGDEVRRTQGGNNNAYCQDNEISWFDWTLLEKHADVHRFVKLLIARRLLRSTEHEQQRVSLNRLIREGEQGLARRQAEPAGLGRPLAQPGVHGGDSPRGGAAVPPDPERVLGAARLRAAAAGQGAGTRGGAGSTPPRSRPTTSSPGRRPGCSRDGRTGPKPARSWPFMHRKAMAEGKPNIEYGKNTGSIPDGRRAGRPFARTEPDVRPPPGGLASCKI